MRKLFLLRGAPGSGKSSFIARHHLTPYASVVIKFGYYWRI